MIDDTAPHDDRSFFANRIWSGFSAADLEMAALVPTMLKFEEQAYYVALTRDWARGAGAIVDLGSFAGGSAACLAEGVAQAGRVQTVHGYDKFDVTDFEVFAQRYQAYCQSPPACDSPHPALSLVKAQGDDLLPVAESFLSHWGKGIHLHKGQIEELGWDGGPIEVLVMDASKTAETMDKMSAQFFPHLVPGRSLVVQQDFLWWQQPWIAVQMAVLQDYFEPVVHVNRDSVSFLCKQEVPLKAIAGLKVDNMTDDDMIAHLRDMKQRVKSLRIDKKMRQLIASVRSNPGERKAFRFRTKP